MIITYILLNDIYESPRFLAANNLNKEGTNVIMSISEINGKILFNKKLIKEKVHENISHSY